MLNHVESFCDRGTHNQPGKALNRALHKATGRPTLPGTVYINRTSNPTGRSRRKQPGARPQRVLYPQPGVLNRSNCGKPTNRANRPTRRMGDGRKPRGWASLWVIKPPSCELSQLGAAVRSWQGEDITGHFREIYLKCFGDSLNMSHMSRTCSGNFKGSIMAPSHPKRHGKAVDNQ